MTIRVSEHSRERLAKLAKSTRRSKSFLAAEAIDAYLEQQSWQVEAIERALTRADASDSFVPHEKVVAWVESWGTPKEQRKPHK